MVIYGTKAVNTGIIPSASSICGNCGEQFKISFNYYRKHVHIFWIPIFPLMTKGYSECSNCKSVLEPKQMPEALKAEYDEKKSEAKKPIWQFVGLVLILGLGTWLYLDRQQHAADEIVYIENPQPNDVYHYKIEAGSYSTLKVIDVTEDSVFVAPNLYEINKVSKVTRISKDENYADFSYGIAKTDLKKMYQKEEIYSAYRKD